MSPAAVERVDVDPHSPWWAEHRSRYHFAGQYVRDKTVLDVACGTGYGGPLLLEAGARSVLGVDASREALAQAERHRRPGFDLLCADGADLPLPDASIEVVVSFETIEHIDDADSFVAELRRVAAPGGLVIVSTPNALHTRALPGRRPNPFHVKEYPPDTFRALLETYFGAVSLVGQRPRPRFRPCPYWETPPNLPRSLGGRARTAIWKLHARLPARPSDRLARWLGRPSFMPGEHDFSFESAETETGHVVVAVCRA